MDPNGVRKLLDHFNPIRLQVQMTSSHVGWRKCNAEITQVLDYILKQSFAQTTVQDWLQSIVTPIYKGWYDMANYRPLSLMCMWWNIRVYSCKITQHLPEHDLLGESQHSFRSGRLCVKRLVQFIHDLYENLVGAHNRGHKQTGLIFMDLPRLSIRCYIED